MDADATGSLAGVLFGLDGFVLLAAADAGGELEIMVETAADLVPCPECGAMARTKGSTAELGAGPAPGWPTDGDLLGQAGLGASVPAVPG